jgi:hypothetical protein
MRLSTERAPKTQASVTGTIFCLGKLKKKKVHKPKFFTLTALIFS